MQELPCPADFKNSNTHFFVCFTLVDLTFQDGIDSLCQFHNAGASCE